MSGNTGYLSQISTLEGTMRKVYRECLNLDDLPPHMTLTHAPRQRTEYMADRSLEQLGVGVEWLNGRLETYRRWCQSEAA